MAEVRPESVSSQESTVSSVEDTSPEINADQLDSQLYATQYFGFIPKSFSSGIYNAFSEHHHDCLHHAQEAIKQEFPKSVTGKDVETASIKMTDQFRKVLDRTFDRFEDYVTRNIFNIPDNAVLAEDQVHLQYPDVDEHYTSLQQEIVDLKKRIKSAQVFNAHLQKESADLECVQKEWDAVETELKNIFKTCREAGVLDLRESLCFMNQKAEILSKSLGQLKPLHTGPEEREEEETHEGPTEL